VEIVKKILDFLTSFFRNSTAKKVEEVKLAEKTEEAVVEKIRATSNAQVIQQQEKTQEALEEVIKKQQKAKPKKRNKKTDDEQFGSDW